MGDEMRVDPPYIRRCECGHTEGDHQSGRAYGLHPVRRGRLTHVWRWATIADPNRPSAASTTLGHARLARRIVHPLAQRAGHPCRELARGSNGNRLIEFADGYRVVAPFYAVRRPVSAMRQDDGRISQ